PCVAPSSLLVRSSVQAPSRPSRSLGLPPAASWLAQREGLPPLGFRAGAEDAPVALADRDVVDAGLAAAHQAVGGELPQFVAVAAVPLALAVVGLVLVAHRDPVVPERPHFLAQGVVQLAVPLAAEEADDLGAAGDELMPVAPHRVLGVRTRDPLRVAGVPRVLAGLHLLPGGVLGERRQRRPWRHCLSPGPDPMAAYARGRVAFMIRAQAIPTAAATAKTAGKIHASAEPGATPSSVA